MVKQHGIANTFLEQREIQSVGTPIEAPGQMPVVMLPVLKRVVSKATAVLQAKPKGRHAFLSSQASLLLASF